eukprot:4408100-Pyramimonas_sp.AAC.1
MASPRANPPTMSCGESILHAHLSTHGPWRIGSPHDACGDQREELLLHRSPILLLSSTHAAIAILALGVTYCPVAPHFLYY